MVPIGANWCQPPNRHHRTRLPGEMVPTGAQPYTGAPVGTTGAAPDRQPLRSVVDETELVADRTARAVHAGRVARLVRWGWDRTQAADLADLLSQRDGTDDDRVACAECAHYRPGRCSNRLAAGLHTADVGRDLAALLQRCSGFAPADEPPARAAGGLLAPLTDAGRTHHPTTEDTAP